MKSCLSFENRRKLFDIHVRVKFALVIARRPGPTSRVQVGFYLDDFAQIDDPLHVMHYDTPFIRASGGEHLAFLELRSPADFAVAERMFLRHRSLRDWTAACGITLGREMNITDDAHRVVPIGRIAPDLRPANACLPMHEGKTIHQFNDRWDAGPRYAVPLTELDDKPGWRESARYFRLALRRIARSTDECTAIAAFTSPGYLFDITAQCERTPQSRSNAVALQLCAVLDSHVFDWALRQKTAVTINLFILEACPVCDLHEAAARFLAHAALRLSCNHAAYASLWQEQLGGLWREAVSLFGWPVIPAARARWLLRAAIDAVVAHAYGLSRADYQRILASFSHSQCKDAPALCVAAYDALTQQGIEAFCQENDPYCDLPLVTSLAEPAITFGDARQTNRLRRAS